MKKSLIIRWVIIALVILVWIWAIFPIKDKDFRSMFEKVSRKNVAKLQTEAKAFIDEKKVDPTELIKKVNSIEDQTSQEFKDASAKLKELRDDKGFAAWRQNEDYQELVKRLNLIDRKVKYETAAAHKAQMDSIANKDSDEFKFYEKQYKAITEEPGYQKWTESIEYKELVRRLPVSRMKAQLELFPEGLYDVWQLNRGQFIQKVLYMHIPYDVLWKLVSGIAFVEAAERRDDVGTTVDEQEEPSTNRLHLPKALATPRAKEYWQRLQEAGFVDARCRLMPETSRRQAMYIAEVFAEKAGIRSKWSTFQQLWGLKNLAQEKWSFLQTAQLPQRSKEIDALFEK